MTIPSPEPILLQPGPSAPDNNQRWLRFRVLLRRRALDREIARGLPLEADAERALRARQLTSRSERCCVAACLANILEAADERHADPASSLRLCHAAVLANRPMIVDLIDALRSERVLTARAIALARVLTQDARSPLFSSRPDRTVAQAVSEAVAAL